jgi:hypothetical protein
MAKLPITQRHAKALSPEGLRPTDAPAWIDTIDYYWINGAELGRKEQAAA